MEDRRRRERENAAGPGDVDNLDNSDGDEDNLDGDDLDDYNDDHGNEDNNVHGDDSIITVIYRPGNPNLMRNFFQLKFGHFPRKGEGGLTQIQICLGTFACLK